MNHISNPFFTVHRDRKFVLDKNHRVVSWNRAVEEYSGIRESEILGTTDQWKGFYDTKQPVLADLILDKADMSAFKKSSLVEGAYEFTEYFPKMRTHGVWLHFTGAPSGTIREPLSEPLKPWKISPIA